MGREGVPVDYAHWRGQPLSLEVIVNLIGATRAAEGLRVYCELDSGQYPMGRKVSDAEMDTVKLDPHRFHGDWNSTIRSARATIMIRSVLI